MYAPGCRNCGKFTQSQKNIMKCDTNRVPLQSRGQKENKSGNTEYGTFPYGFNDANNTKLVSYCFKMFSNLKELT